MCQIRFTHSPIDRHLSCFHFPPIFKTTNRNNPRPCYERLYLSLVFSVLSGHWFSFHSVDARFLFLQGILCCFWPCIEFFYSLFTFFKVSSALKVGLEPRILRSRVICCVHGASQAPLCVYFLKMVASPIDWTCVWQWLEHSAYSLMLVEWMNGMKTTNKWLSLRWICSVLHTKRLLASLHHGLAKNTRPVWLPVVHVASI